MQVLLEHIHLNLDSIEVTEQFLLTAMSRFLRRGSDFEGGYGN